MVDEGNIVSAALRVPAVVAVHSVGSGAAVESRARHGCSRNLDVARWLLVGNNLP